MEGEKKQRGVPFWGRQTWVRRKGEGKEKTKKRS